MSRRRKITLIIAISFVSLLIILTLISIGSQSSIALWLILAIGLALIGARIYSALPITARNIVKTKLPVILAIAAVIIALCFLIPWLKNKINERLAKEPARHRSPINYPYDYTVGEPFQRVAGKIEKVNDWESEVTMNGSESEVDTGLTLEPGDKFAIEQIMFDDPKKNRLSYNRKGDAAPIWGGNDLSGPWPVKYKMGHTGNGVLAIVRTGDQDEKVFWFKPGRTHLEGCNPFARRARVILYYNCIIEFREADGHLVDGRSQNGWDGSTVTVHVWIVNDDGGC